MKKLKRIIIWTLIPVVIELAGLLFMDKFYFNDELSFNIKKVDVSSKQEANKINVKVPDEAKDIKISHDGKYISYYNGQSLIVIDTSNNDKKEVTLADSNELSYYTWFLDTNNILIAEKATEAGSSYLKFESYDPKKDVSYAVKNEEKNQQLSILLPDKEYEVKYIAFSGASNVTYISSGKEQARSRIYRVNIMNQMNLVNFVNCELGNIKAVNTQNGDELVYEDRTYNRIRTGRGGVIATGENAKHYLLNTDKENNIYIGNGDNNKVNKIFVTNLKSIGTNWQTHTLSEYTDKNNVYITRNGKIYINDPDNSQIKELSTSKVTKYSGKLISVYDYGVISQNGNKIKSSLF
ncbi:hypothetical protein ACJDU8_04645 [Clostridium sp. WILCCON 0269]|uniref:Dipeptidylpeptidase IV N-terminal domain-containing protein n=1 Tax=Candidatus Clostridium eludens TaxID=3381663 RepID=A0ABW8SG62_9CLOT